MRGLDDEEIMQPELIKGGIYKDERGSLKYNNDFDAAAIKRFYIIENRDTDFVRGWQGHEIEQRWFSAVSGSFSIKLMAIDNWQQPGKDLPQRNFTIHSGDLDILYCPPGYVSAIQALEPGSRLLVMADYLLNVTKDEHRYPLEYFLSSDQQSAISGTNY